MTVEQLYDIYLQHPTVFTDTRKVQRNGIFFALKGDRFNGNLFAAQAVEEGAAYAVVDETIPEKNERIIQVENVLATLQELAHHHRMQLAIPFIAITGSNGKTTTKELVAAVLTKKYRTYATRGNLNNHIGIPLTLLSIKKDAEMAIVEMGANHQQEIASYCPIAEPGYGIITNCGKAHIEGFGGEEGVRKGKGELYDYLRNNDGAIFRNADLPYLANMAGGIKEQYTYGTSGTYCNGQPLIKNSFLSVKIQYEGKDYEMDTQLVGGYNFSNVMTAVTVGLHFDVNIDDVCAAIAAYSPDNSRSQMTKKGTNHLVLDAYNANPTSMAAAIENFAASPATTKCLWLGGMREMGKDEQKEHEALISLVDAYPWSQVILVGREFQGIPHKYLWFEDSTAAAAYLRSHRPENSYILVKGSRGSKMEIMLEGLEG